MRNQTVTHLLSEEENCWTSGSCWASNLPPWIVQLMYSTEALSRLPFRIRIAYFFFLFSLLLFVVVVVVVPTYQSSRYTFRFDCYTPGSVFQRDHEKSWSISIPRMIRESNSTPPIRIGRKLSKRVRKVWISAVVFFSLISIVHTAELVVRMRREVIYFPPGFLLACDFSREGNDPCLHLGIVFPFPSCSNPACSFMASINLPRRWRQRDA